MIESGSAITGTRNIGGHDIEYKTAEEHATLDRNDFMHLFVTELQYQDPMKPMDSAEMSSQLAQFNMVDLLNANNEAMNKLVESDRSRTNVMAVGFIGHEVRYKGNEILVKQDGPAPFELSLDDPCVSCTVTIKDLQGNVIDSWNMGALEPGTHSLDWDGTDASGEPLEPGVYKISITALDNNGDPVEVTTETTGIVAGLEYQEEGLPKLVIYQGPSIALDDVASVAA